jgi:hypothetical protein
MKLSSLSLGWIARYIGAVALAGGAASASAGILGTFTDGTWTTAGAEDSVGAGGFVNPGYGGQAFDAEYLFYKQSGSILTIGLQSGFNLSTGHQVVNGKTYYAGDLALSFDGSAPYEYGIDFGLLTKDYGTNNVNNTGQNLVDTGSGTGIDSAGLYAVTTWNTNILFGASSPFAIDAGTKIASLLSDSMGSGISGGNLSYYRIVSFDLANLGLGSNLDLHWTMSCGNDAINGSGRVTTVPEPGTLSLLGFGLLGLGALRRRRSTPETT